MRSSSRDDRNRVYERDTVDSVALVDFLMPVRNPNRFCNPFRRRMWCIRQIDDPKILSSMCRIHNRPARTCSTYHCGLCRDSNNGRKCWAPTVPRTNLSPVHLLVFLRRAIPADPPKNYTQAHHEYVCDLCAMSPKKRRTFVPPCTRRSCEMIVPILLTEAESVSTPLCTIPSPEIEGWMLTDNGWNCAATKYRFS